MLTIKRLIVLLSILYSVSMIGQEHVIAQYDKGDDGFDFYFLKDTLKNTVGIRLLSGETLFPPIYGKVCYYGQAKWGYFLIHDSLCHAGIYSRTGECIISESRGYDEVVGGTNDKCFFWQCFQQIDSAQSYISALCDLSGKEVFVPQEHYPQVAPMYYKHRLFYLAIDIETQKWVVLDKNGELCPTVDEVRGNFHRVLRPNREEDGFVIDVLPRGSNPYAYPKGLLR